MKAQRVRVEVAANDVDAGMQALGSVFHGLGQRHLGRQAADEDVARALGSSSFVGDYGSLTRPFEGDDFGNGHFQRGRRQPVDNPRPGRHIGLRGFKRDI